MSTKIAVIGSSEFISYVHLAANEIADIEIEPYIYQTPQEAGELIKNIKPCDAVFFSGALPYYFSKTAREQLTVPSLFLEQDELAVASSLLSVLYHDQISLKRISVDLANSAIVTNVLKSVDMNDLSIHVIDYKNLLAAGQFDIEQIVSFHQSLSLKGETDLALTSVHAVYDHLKRCGVPVKRMIDPKTSLIRGLQTAKDQAEYIKSQAAQVAIIYVSLHQPEEHSLQKINAFAHEVYASLQQVNESLFMLYSTRGNTETAIKHDRLRHFTSALPDGAAIGFGYGLSIKEADQNALVALRFAEKDRLDKCAYILTEAKELLGPFPKEEKQLKLVTADPSFFEIAKKTKLSPANLSKIIQFCKSRQSVQFTSADLSSYLQVTRRSTERIIKKLTDHGYATIVGEEMTYQQGRPRAVYELNLPIYN